MKGILLWVLLGALLGIVAAQGYREAFAGISLPNPGSVSFHESMGFRREGRFESGIRSPSGGFAADIPMAWLRSRVTAD